MKKTQWFGLVAVVSVMAAVAMFYSLSRPVFASHVRISANPWVGYTPFMYAQEKGWLENTPFRFVWLVDLSENARLFERGFTEGLAATQYEVLTNQMKGVRPVFLIDRSAGADAVLSNLSLDALRKQTGIVNVYLERGSLSEDLFSSFVRDNHLEGVRFNRIGMSQKRMWAMSPASGPTVILSYQPYLSKLLSKGYKPLSTTRDLQSFLVIDALFFDEETIRDRQEDLVGLHAIFERAVGCLKRDPKEYYATVRGYLEGQSYEEFIRGMEGIEWFDHRVPDKVIGYLQHQNIPTEELMR